MEMAFVSGRYAAENAPSATEGWTLERMTPPSRLFGANGMRTGADGRIYVAQLAGSQISAVDVATGAVEAVSAIGSDIVGPDDLVFDAQGNMIVTEMNMGRVSIQERGGRQRALRGDLPAANGITIHQDRLFIDECRMDGRLMELDRNTGEPKILLENLPLPNACEVGPDGMLYFPLLGANEIWRVNPEGGEPEVVAKDLGVPDALKFDPQGFIVSTQVHSGEVLRIDPRTGAKTVLAALDPGLDNLVFVGDRLFVSHMTTGAITEILKPGETRALLPNGLSGPLGIAMADDGRIYIGDNTGFYVLTPGGTMETLAILFTPGYPGGVRGLAAAGGGRFVVTTTGGVVADFWPYEQRSEVLAQGLDQLYGVALAPNGGVYVAELGAGRALAVRGGEVEVLARGLREPRGVAVGPDGECLVSESKGGRVVKAVGGKAETVVDGLREPHGILVRGQTLFIVDALAKTLVAYDLQTKQRRVIAEDLPVGAPKGVTPKALGALPPFAGPLGPFAAITEGPDGTLYISDDADGSVVALHPPKG
jgi:sugar lactone lactonase YvrE